MISSTASEKASSTSGIPWNSPDSSVAVRAIHERWSVAVAALAGLTVARIRVPPVIVKPGPSGTPTKSEWTRSESRVIWASVSVSLADRTTSSVVLEYVKSTSPLTKSNRLMTKRPEAPSSGPV